MKEYIVHVPKHLETNQEKIVSFFGEPIIELIRCKDCKNWEADEDERCMYCGEGVLPKTEACMGFGYCSMAERKVTG